MAPTRKGKKKVDRTQLEVDVGPSAGAKPGKGGKASIARADWKDSFKKKQAGVSDMTLLSTISEDAINDNLKKRFENAEIYTYIGHVLISVNPFRMLPIYTDEVLRSYRGKNRLEMPPHVYAIAESMYYNLMSYKENQCVIISGESGAGKTEAAKRIMQYIAEVAGPSGGSGGGIATVKDMVLATNPLLESFGNAKTLRNNNSSRFGKYLEIEFDAQGAPVGALITNYLLEKGRVVGQIKDERNFHIFYQLTKGASAAQKEALGLQGPSAYAYTAKSNCLDVPGIDDVADWKETMQAMQTIGISDAEQSEILRCLAIVLWLGNVTFREDAEGNSAIVDASVPEFVAYLMEIDVAAVNKALTSRVMETQRGFGGAGGRRGSVYEVPLNPAQAAAARDALAKAIYSNLFDWIVERINRSMKSQTQGSLIIGVLDIYGFEIFDNNSFEQLCINYVNEKLQQIFIELTLKTEQEEYVREQIKWTPIQYFNNQIVCDLIEGKRPPGIFAALNDACATAHADPAAADNSFVQRLGSLSSHPQFESRGSKFLVKHYAGDVMYNVSGMTDKNKDVLNKDLLDLAVNSSNPFLQGLFPDRPDPDSKKRPPTQGDKIKTSANALVDKLMRSQPSYIRTIKPNQNKSASEYDTKAILHQIKYLGLKENIRVRRAGFAYRNTFEKMIERFYLLSPATSYAGDYIWQGDSRSGCERILKDTGIAKEEWQMGLTKAFIKNPETLFALETMRDRYWHNMATRIQRAWRNYVRYRNECASRIQRFWLNKKEGIQYIRLRDYGHQVLGQRKERRRYSLVSMRQFRGDYLDVNGKSAFGQALRAACNMGSSEAVAFSMRCEILVSKLGRSSRPSPRFLILTNGAIYILISQLVQNRPTTTLERKIPLTTIIAVSLSTLRDDWIVLNTRSNEEGDPVISCVFKTEFITHLQQQTNGGVSVLIGPTVEYAKKKDKKATIKFTKDESVTKNDIYKSHEVRVGSGEPPNSVSRPPARQKPGVVKPVTQGKLLRPGGPGKAPAMSRAVPAPKPKPKAQALPTGNVAAPPPAPAILNNRVNGAGAAAAAPTPSTARVAMMPVAPVAKKAAAPPMASVRTPPAPPRPPVAAPAPSKPMWKALYDFQATADGEIALTKGELVEMEQKDDGGTGWCLIKKASGSGWAPTAYLKEEPVTHRAPPPAPAKRAPPAPPKANGSGKASPAIRSSVVPATPVAAGVRPGENDLAAAIAARLRGRG